MLTPERLAAIKERLDNATPGRWFYDSYASVLSTHTDFDDLVCRVPCQHGDTAMGRHQADATFIAHSRQDVADLLSEIERLQSELADYQERERDSDRVITNAMKNLQGDKIPSEHNHGQP